MTKVVPIATFFASTFILLLFVPRPLLAGECATIAIMARGEESRFVWLAKVKARALWRQKVRAMPGLGPNYSNWSRAQNTEERCLTGGAGTICIFTGTPCLP